MKKLFTTLTFMLMFAVLVFAQSKFTPQALLSIERKQLKVANQSLAPGSEAPVATVNLVVKIDGKNAVETINQLREAGAVIRTKLGHQVTLSIPVDKVDNLDKIEGVLRIDNGHKGRMKTDVTRREIGVNSLNGPDLPEGATAYTGKGVNVVMVDIGIDFNHPAFKDANGNSRIKCVYVNNDESGHKFTVTDPEAGEITFPGSLFDTPELIATLTSDLEEESHGTHTTGIAAGSISPQGFGGMAPEADLILIPFGFVDEDNYEDQDEFFEEVIAFAAAYAKQSDQPTVLSGSMNSHAGPHDGTGSVCEALEKASESLIPVLSAGNEGETPIHLYHKFNSTDETIKTLLLGVMESSEGGYSYETSSNVSGYTRAGEKVGIRLVLKKLSNVGSMSTVWTSPTVTATPGCDPDYHLFKNGDVEALNNIFDGNIGLAAVDNEDGRLLVQAMVEGKYYKNNNVRMYLFELDVIGDKGTEIDLWDDVAGFGGVGLIGLPGYVDGNNEMSAGDWTCTDKVISVGAYCSNITNRFFDGTTDDTSSDYTLNAIAPFSSYGEYSNEVSQPTVCAPGVNIVSAWSQYQTYGTVAESMKWNDGTYNACDGTSMACPVVSGTVALWLQAKSDLTVADVKNVLKETSINDEFTAQTPVKWGFGKINAAKGIEYLVNPSGVETVKYDVDINADEAYYDLMGRRYTTRPAAGLYIHKGKKVIIK